jgi:hypothetical protein
VRPWFGLIQKEEERGGERRGGKKKRWKKEDVSVEVSRSNHFKFSKD